MRKLLSGDLSRSALVLMCTFGLSFSATAQESVLEEVLVTGSFIRGTPEDAALPVDVLNRSDLEDVGDPSLIDMVRNLGVSSGNLARIIHE